MKIYTMALMIAGCFLIGADEAKAQKYRDLGAYGRNYGRNYSRYYDRYYDLNNRWRDPRFRNRLGYMQRFYSPWDQRRDWYRDRARRERFYDIQRNRQWLQRNRLNNILQRIVPSGFSWWY